MARFRLIADYDKIDEDCCFVGNVVTGPTGAAIRAIGGNINSGRYFHPLVNLPTSRRKNKIKNFGASVQGDIEFGAFTLTSISAYREIPQRQQCR